MEMTTLLTLSTITLLLGCVLLAINNKSLRRKLRKSIRYSAQIKKEATNSMIEITENRLLNTSDTLQDSSVQ